MNTRVLKRKTIEVNEVEFVVFGADEKSFMITSTLIIKGLQAVLIGTSFTQQDAKKIAAFVQEKNLDLTAIYLLHGDPDYYFGLEAIKESFPFVIAYSTKETFEHIVDTIESKLTVWKDVLGDDLPQNIILPKINLKSSIELLDETWQIIGGDLSRINLWNSELRVLIGGIDTFNEIHLFLADTSTKEKLTAWSERVNHLIQLEPTLVIPSHGSLNKSFDVNGLQYTKNYLDKVLEFINKTMDSVDFIKQLQVEFPGLENQGVLELSAKVQKKKCLGGNNVECIL